MDRQRWTRLALTEIVLFGVIGAVATWQQRYLYGDGAFFFVDLLRSRDVSHWFPARQFAHLITQFPAVLLMRFADLTDCAWVGSIYGATLMLIPVAALAITVWAAREAPGEELFLPLLSFALVFLDTTFYAISEAHVASGLFWCNLSLLLYSRKLTLIRSAMLLGLSILATRTYELYLFLSWPLIVAAVVRGRGAWRDRRRLEALTCLLIVVLNAIAFGTSAWWTLYPRDPVQRTVFALAFGIHLAYPPVWFALLAILWAFLAGFFPGHERARRIVEKLLVGTGLVTIAMPLLAIVIPMLQAISRVQLLYIPFLLGLLAMGRRYSLTEDVPSSATSDHTRYRLAFGACIVACVFQTGATLHWGMFRAALLQELSDDRGVIAFEDSRVTCPRLESLIVTGSGNPANHPASGGVFEPLRDVADSLASDASRLRHGQFVLGFGWSMPSLSIGLSVLNRDRISTIIAAPEWIPWQPFDSKDPRALPDLSAYDVQWAPQIKP